MEPKQKKNLILVVDKQDYWLQLSAKALTTEGFDVQVLGNYNDLHFDAEDAEQPDLVVLGCANIGPEEQKLIERVLNNKHHLLVLCTSLPWRVMHALFLTGADDVAEKPYDAAHLIGVVNQALESVSLRNSRRTGGQTFG